MRRKGALNVVGRRCENGRTARHQGIAHRIIAALLGVAVAFSPHTANAQREPLRIATWNIEHLGMVGQGCLIRTKSDLEVLKGYVAQLDAEIIAFQEVASKAAAEQVFDPSEYQVFISDRSIPDARPFCWNRPPAVLGDLRTGFAVRRTVNDFKYTTLKSLWDVTHEPGGMPAGSELLVRVSEQSTLRLLNVHLASGCPKPETPIARESCRLLPSQSLALGTWIANATKDDASFAIVGDFNRTWSSGDPFWAALKVGDETRLATRDTPTDCHSPGYVIDHFLVSAATEHRWAAPKVWPIHRFDYKNYKISDHCAVSIDYSS